MNNTLVGGFVPATAIQRRPLYQNDTGKCSQPTKERIKKKVFMFHKYFLDFGPKVQEVTRRDSQARHQPSTKTIVSSLEARNVFTVLPCSCVLSLQGEWRRKGWEKENGGEVCSKQKKRAAPEDWVAGGLFSQQVFGLCFSRSAEMVEATQGKLGRGGHVCSQVWKSNTPPHTGLVVKKQQFLWPRRFV